MSAPRWLSPGEREAWLRFVAVLELLPNALDAQLLRDAELTQFEYITLAMLSESEQRMLRMSQLASHTNATLPRLSRVVAGLERRGYVDRLPCPEDRRATLARLTETGWQKVVAAAPGHVENVRRHLFDALAPCQIDQLSDIAGSILTTLDPEGRMLAGARLAAGGDHPGSASEEQGHRLPPLSAPAARALRDAGFSRLEQLAGSDAGRLLSLHGIGPSAIRRLQEALRADGLPALREGAGTPGM